MRLRSGSRQTSGSGRRRKSDDFRYEERRSLSRLEIVAVQTVLLLILSNTFMTIAWYGHLKYKQVPLLVAIAVSWLIALPEYALQVPANRYGYGQFTATQLKVIQEVISVSVFAVFVFFYLGETPTWRTGIAFLLIIAAVALVAMDRK